MPCRFHYSFVCLRNGNFECFFCNLLLIHIKRKLYTLLLCFILANNSKSYAFLLANVKTKAYKLAS